MSTRRATRDVADEWIPVPDPVDRFSTGIPDLDRILGGGFRRGSLALFELDNSVETADRDLLFAPVLLNFLHRSRGILAVLPSLDAPREFRSRLTRWVTRRRFDTRVRIVEYVGEDSDAPYVVTIGISPKSRAESIRKMEAAERAVKGARRKPFLEFNSLEILEMIVGPEQATKMFLHGVKRARGVGNLVVGLLRPELRCAPAARAMAEVNLAVRRQEFGLTLSGIRPAFPAHLVLPDPARGPPHVVLLPSP